MKSSYFFIFLSFGLIGCSHTPPKVDLSTAINTIQNEMVKSRTLPISNFVIWTDGQKDLFQKSIHLAQCSQGTGDPVVPVILGPLSINLSGSFTKSGSFQISSNLSIPTIGLSGSGSKSLGQTVGSNLSFISLSTIPSVEQQLEVERAGALLAQNDRNRDAVAQRIIHERSAFFSYVSDLTKRFTILSCDTKPIPPPQYYVGAKFSDNKKH